MTGLMWILAVIWAAGGPLSSASPVLQPVLLVPAGDNISLSCNLASSSEVTWFLLRSDQLLPLLTVKEGKVGGDTVNLHTADRRRVSSGGALRSGLVTVEIQQVEEGDAGRYFCSWRCAESVCVDEGVQLLIDGVDGGPARPPCWSLEICVLLASLVFTCVVVVVGFHLCSGRPAVSCRRSASLRVPEDASLHYSSLKLPNKLRPPGRKALRLAEEEVVYSTVPNHKTANGSHEAIEERLKSSFS